MNAILGRDVAEHAWVLGPALLLTGALLILVTLLGLLPQLSGLAPEGLLALLPVHRDPLGALRAFVILGLTPLAALLVDRLISVEYRRHGWDLLERLPIGRARIVYGKVALIVALLGALLACAWLVVLSASVTFQRPVSDDRAAGAIWAASGYLATVTGYLLATATLGRRRLIAHALVAGGLLWLVRAGLAPRGIPGLGYLWGRGGGPLGLALGGALVLLAFVHACAAQGRLARACQGPIRRADLGLPAALAVALLIAATPQPAPAAYPLRGRVARAGPVAVRVPADDPTRAQALADALAGDLAWLTALGAAPPAVSIEHAPALDAGTWERARDGRALLLRLNVERAAPGPGLRAAVLHAALDRVSQGRLRSGGWRLLRDGAPGLRVDDRRGRERLLAAWALTRVTLSPELLLRWERAEAACGADAARALAAWALRELDRTASPDASSQLLARALRARRAPGGALGRRDAAFRALVAEVGGSFEAWAARLQARADALRRAEANGLTRLPASAPGASPRLEDGHLVVDGRRDAGLALLHGRLPDPRHVGRGPDRWERDEAASGLPLRSARRYPAGARVRVALVAHVAWLEADLVFGWRELRVP